MGIFSDMFQKKPAVYQNPLLDRACYVQIKQYDKMRNETNAPVFRMESDPTHLSGGYRYFMDYMTLAMDRFPILGVIALLDANKNPIPINGFDFSFETITENDCAFMYIFPKR